MGLSYFTVGKDKPSDTVCNIIIYQINLIFQCDWQMPPDCPGEGNLVTKIPAAGTNRIKTIKQNIKKFKPFWGQEMVGMSISSQEDPFDPSDVFPDVGFQPGGLVFQIRSGFLGIAPCMLFCCF